MAGTTSATGKWVRAEDLWTGTIGTGGVADGTVTTIPLASVTGLTDGKTYIVSIDRVDANGTTTSSTREVVQGLLSSTNLTTCTRGLEGTAQAHSAGAVVEILMTATHWNQLLDGLEAEHNPDDGTHTAITATSITTTGNATVGGDAAVTGAITGASATTTGDVDSAGAVKADTVSEHTAATGVTVDGVLLKDSQVTTDTINEKTAAAGVTVDSLPIKDGGSYNASSLSGVATAASNFTTTSTTAVDITDMSVTITLPAAAVVMAIATAPMQNDTADSYASLYVNIDGTGGGEALIHFPSASKWYNNVAVARKACAAGSITIKATALTNTGTLSIRNGAQLIVWIA